MKKAIALGLGTISALSLLSGCGGGNAGGEAYDPSNVYVSVYSKGVGSDWITQLANEYNALHPETKIKIEPNTNEYATIRDELRAGTSKIDVYFSDGVRLEELNYLGLLADVTDIMDDKSGTENKSILDKMSDAQKEFYNVGTASSPKYTALPYQLSPTGIVYDHDLFVERGFLDDYEGPDGQPGTQDDGLPRTYEEFKDLLLTMKRSGVTPFSWSCDYEFYTGFLLRSIWAQYEGLENYSINYTFEGTDSNLGKITPETGYKLFNQQGIYQALKFVEECMIPTGYATDASFIGSSHTGAQDQFILSSQNPMTGPTGMIITGSWWENESRGTFMSAYREYGTRDFRFLPLPKFEGQKGVDGNGNGSVLFNWNDDTAIFVNKNTAHLDVAKDFLKFMNTDYALAKFTTMTNCLRALDYSLTAEEKGQLTKFGLSVWKMVKENPTVTVIGKTSKSPIINYSSPLLDNYRFNSTIDSAPYYWPASAMHSKTSITAETYWQGMKDYYSESAWTAIYNSVKNYF
ncbi:MAG: ABC transporter substrate-binding protein [Candidatus Scatosoma sp.]